MKKIITTVLSLFIICFAMAQEKPEGLFINSKAPDFKLTDQQTGEVVWLKELRKKGNVVVVFYRGNWCPYCSRYIKKLQDSLEYIKAKGAELVVITPEAAEGIDSTISESGATFPVLHDKNMELAKGYKVAFRVDDKTLGRYRNADIDLLKINEQTKEAYLPVPAVYIVNTDGAITFRFFDENYKKRVSVKGILDALDGK